MSDSSDQALLEYQRLVSQQSQDAFKQWSNRQVASIIIDQASVQQQDNSNHYEILYKQLRDLPDVSSSTPFSTIISSLTRGNDAVQLPDVFQKMLTIQGDKQQALSLPSVESVMQSDVISNIFENRTICNIEDLLGYCEQQLAPAMPQPPPKQDIQRQQQAVAPPPPASRSPIVSPAPPSSSRNNNYSALGKRNKIEDVNEAEDEEEELPMKNDFKTAKQELLANKRKRLGANEDENEEDWSKGSKAPQTKKEPPRDYYKTKFVPPYANKNDNKNDNDKPQAAKPSNSGAPPAKKQKVGEKGDKSIAHLFENGEVPEELQPYDPLLVESIFNEILKKDTAVKWSDIIGLESAKDTVFEFIVWPMFRPDLFHGARSAPKGLLLFGPPGTGKTMIGKAIASESNATFFSISAASLMSKWIGDGEKMVRTLFAVAKYKQPSVIFIDEIDSILSKRSDGDADNVLRRMKTEFLVRLDGADSSASDKILLIGATNRPQEIDEAVRRRMAKQLYIPLPNGDARVAQVVKELANLKSDLTEKDLEKIKTLSEGYSGSDIKHLVRDAAYGPLREQGSNIKHVTAEELRPINLKDFRKSFKKIRPSVDPKSLVEYEEWNKLYGAKDDEAGPSQDMDEDDD